MGQIFLTGLIFLLPFVILPFGNSYFEVPKVITAEIVIALLYLTFFLNDRLPKPKYPVWLIFITSLFAVGVSLINFKQYTLFGNPFRMQGLYFLLNLMLLGYISSRLAIKIPALFQYIVFSLIVITAFLFGTTEDNRIIGLFGEPNSLGAYVLFLWPFLLYTVKNKYLKILILILTITIVFFTGSRSSLIGLNIQILFLILSKKINYALTTIICVLLLSFSLTLPFIDDPGLYQNRAVIWMTSLQAFKERALLGYGFGNIEYAIHDEAVKNQITLQNEYVDSSHNLFIDWLLQGGMIGLLLLTAVLSTAVFLFIKVKNVSKITAFLGIISVMMFNPVSAGVLIPFWWLIGSSGYSHK